MNGPPPAYADVNAKPPKTEDTTHSMEKEGHQLAGDKQSSQQANTQTTTVPTAQTVSFAAPPQMPMTVNSGTQMMFFDAHPIAMKCPHCGTEMRTKISYEAGTMVVVCFIGLLLVGLMLFFPLFCSICFLPFVMDDCQVSERRGRKEEDARI
ncbi:hypothetical protein M3Y94_00951500 [Aphelenchoides besseyi]|nr:hypothetical protein M3Y94_00951500 [Aphelenchoides besseyi]